MATAPENPPADPTSTSTSPAASSDAPLTGYEGGTRKLDDAAGGDEIPAGPLGGPHFKTNDTLNAERIAKEKEQAEADAAAAADHPAGEDTAAGGDTTSGSPLS